MNINHFKIRGLLRNIDLRCFLRIPTFDVRRGRPRLYSSRSCIFAFFNNPINAQILSWVIILVFFTNVLIPSQMAHAQSVINLPAAGTMIAKASSFVPPMVRGITIYPQDPFRFDFIIDAGDSNLRGEALGEESNKLIKYFLASLTVPEKEMWVNLSPYEKNRIIAQGLSKTVMGADLLAQDYILKQLTASLMFPENELGEKFWKRVYEKAHEKYGTTEIPINTFNKIWIVPDKAHVYVKERSVFVTESHLKVLLEEDYLALESNTSSTEHGLGDMTRNDLKIISGVSSEIVREVLIPEIEKEVNSGEHFSNLRQIYNSMILATWYKQNLKSSLLGHTYIDKNRSQGIDLIDKEIHQRIYEQYVKAFAKGVVNFVREEYDESTQQIIPRKYFSGGVDLSFGQLLEQSSGDLGFSNELKDRPLSTASVFFDPVRNLDRLIRILNVFVSNNTSKVKSSDEKFVLNGASEDRVLDYIVQLLQEKGFIRELPEKEIGEILYEKLSKLEAEQRQRFDGKREMNIKLIRTVIGKLGVIPKEERRIHVWAINPKMKQEVGYEKLTSAIDKWVINAGIGVKAVNWKKRDGGSREILGYERNVQDQLERELREHFYMEEEGMSPLSAYNKVSLDLGENSRVVDVDAARAMGFRSAQLDSTLSASLGRDYFGFDAVEIYKEILRDKQVLDLMEGVLSQTIPPFLGLEGADFVRRCFRELRSLAEEKNSEDLTTEDIKEVFLRLRTYFPKNSVQDNRRANFKRTIGLINPEVFKGYIVDLGSNDNMFGEVLLELYDDQIDHIEGVDIEKRPNLKIGRKLGFTVQSPETQILPIESNIADTVIVSFAFHHMTVDQQRRYIKEIRRILKEGGRLIVFEDTWSFGRNPNEYAHKDFNKRLHDLKDPYRVNLYLAGIDCFSLSFREKNMPFPSTYRSVEEWEEFFGERGFKINNVDYYGIPKKPFTFPLPFGIFVIEKSDKNIPRKKGGIDLNPTVLNLQTNGEMIKLNVPENIQFFQNLQIDGFVPVILKIVPTANLQILLKLTENDENHKLIPI